MRPGWSQWPEMPVSVVSSCAHTACNPTLLREGGRGVYPDLIVCSVIERGRNFIDVHL